ncbi:TraB/GumN family protein [Flavobacterium amniphilum]|uniref:TraB/GumN family protein n=1 Tax=Flavobacterium amniphilum TaxID=1834035 RepID=UPI00202A7ECA|nr:TraB/GumN family protein [Flavobacterium amniphilum]MCL9803918.1 TraB/GumN family protein [Flavobacterium amniphilum]
MKNLFKSILFIVVSQFGLTSNAQTKATENSLLWEISGNGLTKPSYLFGTVHMICGKDYVLKPKVKDAFAKTSKLALEINIADPNEMAAMQQYLMGTELLSKKLTSVQLTELEKILKTNIGVGVKDVDSYSLTTLMSLLSVKSFGCQDLKVYEMELTAKAKEDKKGIIGLETIKAQMEFLGKSYSDDQMMELFKHINEAETQKLVQNYVTENLQGMYEEITNKEVMDANAKKWMLDTRNANWVKIMPEMMKKESVFFAVGSGHLPGDEGVINLLKQKGYTVKPVMI